MQQQVKNNLDPYKYIISDFTVLRFWYNDYVYNLAVFYHFLNVWKIEPFYKEAML